MSAAGAATGAAPARSAPPDRPPGGPERSRWAFGQEVAAEAWGPELGTLIDRLDLHDGDRVLDAGCGAGRITRMLAERVRPSGEVLAIDADPEAVAWAAWRLRDLAGTGASIELRDGWVEHLPWPDAALDGAWCSAVLGYLADPVEAMRELVRVVRPGGRIILLTGDAARATFLPIPPDLEARLRAAERTIAGAGYWGGGTTDLHLGRRLYALARTLPVRVVEARTVVWERTAPLRDVEHRYLHSATAWLTDPGVRPWLGDDWDRCCDLFAPDSGEGLLLRPDLHVVETATAVILTV